MGRMSVQDARARSQVEHSNKPRNTQHLFLRRKKRMECEKPKADRLKECVAILKDLQGLGIPYDCPEVLKLRTHINAYVNDGVCWEGRIDFSFYGRIAEVKLPRRADRAVELLLRVPRAGRN